MIGFSGPVEEKEKRKDHSDSIIDGIGKSSFCARFIKPHQVKLSAPGIHGPKPLSPTRTGKFQKYEIGRSISRFQTNSDRLFPGRPWAVWGSLAHTLP